MKKLAIEAVKDRVGVELEMCEETLRDMPARDYTRQQLVWVADNNDLMDVLESNKWPKPKSAKAKQLTRTLHQLVKDELEVQDENDTDENKEQSAMFITQAKALMAFLNRS